jgi:hypothetical protein
MMRRNGRVALSTFFLVGTLLGAVACGPDEAGSDDGEKAKKFELCLKDQTKGLIEQNGFSEKKAKETAFNRCTQIRETEEDAGN